MQSRLHDNDDYELVNRESSESEAFDLDSADFQSHGPTSSLHPRKYSSSRLVSFVSCLVPFRIKRLLDRQNRRRKPSKLASRVRCGRSRPSRRCCLALNACLAILAVLLALTALLRPSYTDPPAHYRALRKSIESSNDYGRANPEGQKVFIAASIYDEGGDLLGGEWGDRVLDLIDILGNRNVFLSIYENDAGGESMNAQAQFEKQIQCKHNLNRDPEFSADEVEHITLPDGSNRVKRIAYLAKVRNKALLPLEEKPIVKYDKILFMNDVIFDPIEAAQLLLSTNSDEHGHANYRAACAVDFVNPFKFYDTYATRDFDGYSMGVPFFPWFTTSGTGASREDVLQGRDAVRVKSCWGGMVAFDAKPFQSSDPLRFRASPDLYWDASECCLIHADLMNQKPTKGEDKSVGIYMNPFVRVAYSSRTLGWLHFVRRFERLYAVPHNLINHLVGLPWTNPRRKEIAGAHVKESVWTPDLSLKAGGAFQMQTRTSAGDGFCGRKALQLIKEEQRKGEKNWEAMPVPPD